LAEGEKLNNTRHSNNNNLRVQVLLDEYQACHSNRNHYDIVRWAIGSIFIGTSLTIFGLTLAKHIAVVFIAFCFSLILIIFWYLYSQHVNPYVMRSIVRMHNIESMLRSDYHIELHNSILHPFPKEYSIGGTRITFWLFCSVIGMWFVSLTLSLYRFLNNNINGTFLFLASILFAIYVGIIIVFSIIHNKFNAISWKEEMEKASSKSNAVYCEKCGKKLK
jgi:hypothetical protein